MNNIINNIKNINDEKIIELYKENQDNKLLGELYIRYVHLTFNLCFKYLKNDDDSKDAVMEIFDQLMQDINKYEIRHFKSWLYVKTKNYCLHKKNNMKVLDQIDNNFMEFPFFYSHNLKEIDLVDSSQIESAIDKLNTEQKKCIKLFYYDNKSYSEISDLTGYSIKEVKSHLQNGKRNLKKIIQSII